MFMSIGLAISERTPFVNDIKITENWYEYFVYQWNLCGGGEQPWSQSASSCKNQFFIQHK